MREKKLGKPLAAWVLSILKKFDGYGVSKDIEQEQIILKQFENI